MSNRSNKFLIEDMLDAIAQIEIFVRGMNEENYKLDLKTRAAVERYLEILGEAANKFTEDFYNKHDHIKWHRVISLRNRIIHAYFDVSHSVIWNIVMSYLPELKNQLQNILNEFNHE